MPLICKVCCHSLAHIRNEARLRAIRKGIGNYADGVASIRLANVEKHIKSS